MKTDTNIYDINGYPVQENRWYWVRYQGSVQCLYVVRVDKTTRFVHGWHITDCEIPMGCDCNADCHEFEPAVMPRWKKSRGKKGSATT